MADLYASEDAQQILQIAIAKETESGDLTRIQLAEIASELNIAPETLWSAEREWIALKSESSQQHLFNQQRRQNFNSLILFTVLSLGFFGGAWRCLRVLLSFCNICLVRFGGFH